MSITSLPPETQVQICENLEPTALANMAMTCTHWNGLCVEIETKDKDLWRRFLTLQFPHHKLANNPSFKEQFKYEYRFLARYPKDLADVFGGRNNLGKIPFYDSMWGKSVTRTQTYSSLHNKYLIGFSVQVQNSMAKVEYEIKLQENANNSKIWEAFSTYNDAIANPFAKNPDVNDFINSDHSIDIPATAARLKKIQDGTDPQYKII
jgi:hypothetical protein